MSIFTKLGVNVAAPFNADGTPRQISPQDFQIWMTEVERVVKGLLANAGGIELPELIYKYVITGGDENNIKAKPNAEVTAAAGEALFTIDITEPNTGDVRINGKPLLTSSGNQVVAGGLVPGIWLFLDDGASFRLVSDQSSQAIVNAAENALLNAQRAQDATETARDIAVNAASDAVSQGNVPIYSTRNAVEGLVIPAGITAFRTNGYAVPGDGGDSLYVLVALEPPHSGKVQSADGAWWKDVFFSDHLVLIPRDFPTLQQAVDTLSRTNIRNGSRVILRIQSGHRITHGLRVEYGDFSYFYITSEDPVVYLDDNFVGPSDDDVMPLLNSSTDIFILGVFACMPVLGCLVDAQGKCSQGYYGNGSRGRVLPGCGVRYAGRNGCQAFGSHILADGTDWQYAGQWLDAGFQVGVWATEGSVVTVQDRTNVSYSTAIGAGTSRASLLNAQRIIAKGCGTQGIEARRGVVDIQYADLSENILGLNAITGAVVSAQEVSFGASNNAIRVAGNASVNATRSTVSSGTLLSRCSTVNRGLVRPLRSFNLAEGGIIFDNDAPPQGAIIYRKGSNQDYTSPEYKNDSHLQIPVRGGDVWILKGQLYFATGANTVLSIALDGPSASLVVIKSSLLVPSGPTVPIEVSSYNSALALISGDQAGVCNFIARLEFTANGILALRGARTLGSGMARIGSLSMIEATREN